MDWLTFKYIDKQTGRLVDFLTEDENGTDEFIKSSWFVQTWKLFSVRVGQLAKDDGNDEV